MLAGHGTIRKRVMGMADRAPTPDELDSMKATLASAMEQGAWGLSTGLEYTPSGYADVDELAAISSVLVDYGGFYATHLRNEGDQLLEAVNEAIEVGFRAGVPVQLSHHKAEGRLNWGKVDKTLAMVDAARARGVDIRMDQYPYTAFMTSMAVQFLPIWANAGANDDVLARLADPATRQRIVTDMLAAHPEWADLGPDSPWASVEIGVARSQRGLQGRTIADLAASDGVRPVEKVIDLILSEHNFISAINYCIHEDDIARVMRHPLTMIGSDAVGTSPSGKTGEDRVHPRCYGTFARVLGRYVRQGGTITESEAIRKMTSMPADRLGIADRGRLRPGCYADVTVYDPRAVLDNATFDAPHRFSTGVEVVIVNGRVVWEAGAHTGALAGRALRRAS
jgi:N-acyl-D-amino-acid deacylase